MTLKQLYQKIPGDGMTRVSYAVIGKPGAIEVWFVYKDNIEEVYNDCPMGGVEYHYPTGDGCCHHANCFILNGECWHEGTSLGFVEGNWWQYIKEGLVFPMLEQLWRKHFGGDNDIQAK